MNTDDNMAPKGAAPAEVSADAGGKVHLKRSLGFWQVVIYGVAMMFPVAPIAVYGSVTMASFGHMALCYLLAAIPMAFTAYSYGQMAAAYPQAGSAYTFTQKSIHPYLGFMSGWAIFLDYALFPIMNIVIASNYVNMLFGIDYWVSVVVIIIVVTAVNMLGVKSLSWVNNVLVLIMFIAIAYFVASATGFLSDGGGTGFSTLPFYNPDTFDLTAIIAGCSIACFSFMGFDAMTTLAEEVKQPQKVLPKATVFVCLFMGFIFILQAYFAQSVFPDFMAFESVDNAFVEACAVAGGDALVTFISVAMIAGAVANAIDAQAGVARVLYGMGRDRMLPKAVFGHLSKKTQVPVYTLAILAVIIFLGCFLDLNVIIVTINFGAFAAFMCVNADVIAHYFIKGKKRDAKGVVKYLVFPIIGFITCLVLFLGLDVVAKTAGAVWLVVGIIYLAVISKGFRKIPEADLDL